MRRLIDAFDEYPVLTPRCPSITGTYDKPNIKRSPGRNSDPNWPLQLRADIDRQIDGIEHEKPRLMFHKLVRERAPLNVIFKELGYRHPADGARVYHVHYARMVRALSDYFPREAAALAE